MTNQTYNVNGSELCIGEEVYAAGYRGKYAGPHTKFDTDHCVEFVHTGKYAFHESGILAVKDLALD